jgi:hypothetical protein
MVFEEDVQRRPDGPHPSLSFLLLLSHLISSPLLLTRPLVLLLLIPFSSHILRHLSAAMTTHTCMLRQRSTVPIACSHAPTTTAARRPRFSIRRDDGKLKMQYVMKKMVTCAFDVDVGRM